MSCEEAYTEWKKALSDYMALTNPGGTVVVNEAGALAIKAASERFAEADHRYVRAIAAHAGLPAPPDSK